MNQKLADFIVNDGPNDDDPLSDEEQGVGLLTDSGIYKTSQRSHECPLQLQMWTRNPVFYLMLLFGVSGLVGVGFFAPWAFILGSVLSAALAIVCIWFAGYIWDHYTSPDVYSRWEIFKMVFTALALLAATGFIIYLLGVMSFIRFSSTDPEWATFPERCRNMSETGLPLYNCIRVGKDIPNPKTSTGPIVFSQYPTTVANLINIFSELIKDQLSCRIINQQADFVHFRCLNAFWGSPDDLAIKGTCQNGNAVLWVHSQSRLGTWDENGNDARVRLMNAYLTLPSDQWGYDKRLHTNQKCA